MRLDSEEGAASREGGASGEFRKRRSFFGLRAELDTLCILPVLPHTTTSYRVLYQNRKLSPENSTINPARNSQIQFANN